MIVVAGLSHRTAPIAVRERIALPKAEIPRVLRQIVARPSIGEAMLISTCNLSLIHISEPTRPY